mmetsp:Transcript_96252/g.272504  ORF Transcript_96252/g.272504 Transcript_96252/m.272504 type:complete len:231 (+) Transcript_96252:1383-2075(+)
MPSCQRRVGSTPPVDCAGGPGASSSSPFASSLSRVKPSRNRSRMAASTTRSPSGRGLSSPGGAAQSRSPIPPPAPTASAASVPSGPSPPRCAGRAARTWARMVAAFTSASSAFSSSSAPPFPALSSTAQTQRWTSATMFSGCSVTRATSSSRCTFSSKTSSKEANPRIWAQSGSATPSPARSRSTAFTTEFALSSLLPIRPPKKFLIASMDGGAPGVASHLRPPPPRNNA